MDFADIVVIEDSNHDAEMIMDAIHDQDTSSRIKIFGDGSDALDYFFGSKGCSREHTFLLPKFIILDLKLPKVGGIEVLKRLRSDERTKHVPVVVFTSSNELKDRHESYIFGANSYIVKPLDSDAFTHVVRDLATYWISINSVLHDHN